MLVVPIEGEPFRYHVTKRGLLLDLRANYGVGWCGCEDCEYRHQPKLEKFNRLPKEPDKFRCKHCKEVRRLYGPTVDDDMKALGKLRKL